MVDSSSRLYRKDKVLISLFEENITVRVLRHSLEQLQKIYLFRLNKPSITSCRSEFVVINDVKYLLIRYTEYDDEFILYRSDMNKSFVRIGGLVEFKAKNREKAELFLTQLLQNGKYIE